MSVPSVPSQGVRRVQHVSHGPGSSRDQPGRSPADHPANHRRHPAADRQRRAACRLAVAQCPRGLALQLTINPKTVARAYTELTNEGWLDSRQGLGLFVATPRQRLSEAERERRLTLAVEAFVAEVVGLGFPLEHVLDQVGDTLTPYLAQRSA
jgi:GntR family transcriptional regulator